MNTKIIIDSSIVYFRNYDDSKYKYRVLNKNDNSALFFSNNATHKEYITCSYCYLNIPHSVNLHNSQIKKGN